MLLEEQTVLETAIDHYGRRLQTVKACEELTELIAALSRLTCLIETGAPEEEIHAEWDHVLEELADAEIMLQQMRMIYDGGQVDGIRARKLRRLAGRLGLTEYKAPAKPPMDAAEHPEDWSAQISDDETADPDGYLRREI